MLFNAALLLQGGAMRCVFTAGVLDAFMDNDIEFSDVYGISAGSKDAQYYPGKQRGYAFLGDLASVNDPNVFDMANLLQGKPVIDNDYYIKEIRDKLYPLDTKALLESPVKLHVGCTNVKTGKIEYFEKDDPCFTKALCASCALPVLQPMVEIRNEFYLDGGCAEPVPLYTAKKAGFDKIVIVETREKGFRENPNEDAFGFFYGMKYNSYPEFLDLLKNNKKIYNEIYDEIDKLEEEGKVIVIRPSKAPNIDRLERDKDKLKDLYQDGYNEGKKALMKFMDYFKD